MVIDPALRMGLESGVTGRPPACPLSDLFGAGSVRSHLFRSCRLSGRDDSDDTKKPRRLLSYRTKHSETEARI